MVIKQDVMARQMVFREIDTPLEDISIHGAGMAFELAGDNLHPIAPAESVVKTHAMESIGLAGVGAINGCQFDSDLRHHPFLGTKIPQLKIREFCFHTICRH